MRAKIFLVLGLAALASATPLIDENTLVNLDIKQKQTFILKLLNHVLDPVMYKDVEEIGKNYNIETNLDSYTRTDVVKLFLNNLNVGFLPRGEIFTLHVDRQLKEVVAIFHMLYYAKDFATFIKTACWMRLYLNEGMFVYALTVACRHREDCRGIILPPPYEIYPYYFVRADVIQKAYLLKMRRGLLDHKLCDFYGIRKTEKDVYIIDENIYDRRVALNDEDRLRYFTEDIDLNTYYYYFHVDYPFWMRDEIFDKLKCRRFELTLYMYQQILARYYLERLSVGLGEIKTLSWFKNVRQGYWPWMRLHNGVELTKRTNNYVLVRDDNVDIRNLVNTYETIIHEAIVKGYIEINGKRLELTRTDDIELLGKLIYGKIDKIDTKDKILVDAYRYLLIICKSVLGLNTLHNDKYFVMPTVLDQYQTALRDPVFYMLQKRLIDFVVLFKRRLPSYTKEDLLFPGVKIDNVVVDKLVTYFDDYLMDITNGVTLTDDEIRKTKSDMKFLVRKRRLNHQPFKVTLDLVSDKTVDCVVRIFLGPKEDHLGRVIDINRNRLNFVELDTFLYKLVTGKNTIVRNSVDMHNLVRDRVMTRDLWKKLDTVTDMRDLLIKDLRNYHTGFPTRLLLPRGHVGGMKSLLYVIVTPLRLVDGVDLNILDVNRKDLFVDFRSTVLLDKMPLGFTPTDVVKLFLNNLNVGFLPRGEIFTLHVDRQLKEVVAIFHMLYYAKDFATFIKTACWMRLYLNEGMFVYALTVACRHREDCRGIILPPPYEIYPYYFVRADVIQKAYLLKMRRGLLDHKLCDFYGIRKTEKDVYIIDENIYDRRVALNDEDRLRYFTEDIDLNTYYYYFHVDYPFWMRDEIFDKLKCRRFELTLYMYQQILARYYLERLSVGLGEIKTLSWFKNVRQGYWPWMRLHNGVELTKRTNNYVLVRDDNVDIRNLVNTYETIIHEAIVKGYIEINGKRLELTRTDDIELLGKLIYGKIDKIDTKDKILVDAYRYLLIICKSVLGLNTLHNDKYFVMPTVLDQYQTALRDPVFYMLQKRLIDFVVLFKRRLPSYTKEDLLFPGVKIDNVVVDKLVTYFDDYLMDITNGVTLTDDEIRKTKSDMKFLVRKRRLNHQPFKVTLDLVSDKTVDCVVRIFLGPKEDHLGRVIDINRNRLNFVELDTFLYKLVTGKNTIVRNSVDMHNLVRDRVMTRDLWKKLDTVTDMRDLLIKDLRNYHTGFPTRLLLPRGHVGGMKSLLYVIVTPLRLVDGVDLNILDVNRKDLFVDFRSTVLLDKMPLGFPLDRHIDVARFYTPNMKFVDVIIFHKKMVCDMKTRWDRYVLKNYKMTDVNRIEDDTYFTDVDIDTKLVQNTLRDL